jgi:hypothetical protein
MRTLLQSFRSDNINGNAGAVEPQRAAYVSRDHNIGIAEVLGIESPLKWGVEAVDSRSAFIIGAFGKNSSTAR